VDLKGFVRVRLCVSVAKCFLKDSISHRPTQTDTDNRNFKKPIKPIKRIQLVEPFSLALPASIRVGLRQKEILKKALAGFNSA
jgi:hypothetical protein